MTKRRMLSLAAAVAVAAVAWSSIADTAEAGRRHRCRARASCCESYAVSCCAPVSYCQPQPVSCCQPAAQHGGYGPHAGMGGPTRAPAPPTYGNQNAPRPPAPGARGQTGVGGEAGISGDASTAGDAARSGDNARSLDSSAAPPSGDAERNDRDDDSAVPSPPSGAPGGNSGGNP